MKRNPEKRTWFLVLRLFALTAIPLLLIYSSCANPLGNDQLSGSEGSLATSAIESWVNIRPAEGEWNSSLVLLAKGYSFPEGLIPPSLGGINPPDYRPELSALLTAHGYAVAWADYGEDGYAVETAYARTRALPGIYQSHYGDRGDLEGIYVIGGSMGSLIGLMMAEDASVTLPNPPPEAIAPLPAPVRGALVFDGLVGGIFLELEYLGDVRSLFEAFFPWVIPYDTLSFPNVFELSESELAELQAEVFPKIEAWIGINTLLPFRTREFVRIKPPRIPVRTDKTVSIVTGGTELQVPEQVIGILEPLGYGLLGISDILDRTVGVADPDYTVFDNADTVYRGSFRDHLLNKIVPRHSRAPDSALQFLFENYEPSGNLGSTRVLSLRTTRDPVAPIYHEAEYLKRLLRHYRFWEIPYRQIQVRAFGHGVFEPPALLAAFEELIAWENGKRLPMVQWVSE